MARALVWLVIEAPKDAEGWSNIHDSPLIQGRRVGGGFAKLEHWRLIVPKWNDDKEKRCSGLWKSTLLGVDFVYRRVSMPKYVVLYNNSPMSFASERIYISDALETEFDYSLLISHKKWRGDETKRNKNG